MDWIDIGMQYQALRNMEDNFNGYGSLAPDDVSMNAAYSILVLCERLDIKPSAVVASAGDGVCIGFDTENKYAEIECLNNGSIVGLLRDYGKDPPTTVDDIDAWEVAPNKIEVSLARIKEFMK